MFCTNCGGENQDTAHFCRLCGATLIAAPPGPSALRPERTSGKAIASMICGFLFFLLPAAILAILFGHLSLGEIRRSAGRVKGHGMAMTGLVLGYLGIASIPIILIVAAIAIPNLLRARMAANEASAVRSLYAINNGAAIYEARYSNGYPPNLEVMRGLGSPAGKATCDHARLIKDEFVQERKTGYIFTYVALTDEGRTPLAGSTHGPAPGCSQAGAPRYKLTADPITRGSTGLRSFYTDETGVIRSQIGDAANADSPPFK